MKLTVQQVYDATLLLALIMRDQNGVPRAANEALAGSVVSRPMPLKGAYRISRMHAKLLPEFLTINERRDALIKAYDTHAKVMQADGSEADGPDFCVPSDKADEFNAAWREITAEEIEVAVEPIPLAALDMGDAVAGAISASELSVLGYLVTE